MPKNLFASTKWLMETLLMLSHGLMKYGVSILNHYLIGKDKPMTLVEMPHLNINMIQTFLPTKLKVPRLMPNLPKKNQKLQK